MKVGIVGLGLIGASMAAALKEKGHEVLGADKNESTRDFAKMAGSIDGALKDEDIPECDMIILAVTPGNAIDWVRSKADQNLFGKDSIVMDCCGVKGAVCEACFPIAKEKGFKFMGGHPMAGRQVGGYKNSSPELFQGAFFALVPNSLTGDSNDISLISKIRNLLKDAGFSDFAIMTAEEHDEIIAFTSQLAHLISNAYIKSHMAEVGVGTALSGGAFRDLTRIAFLDEVMWTELFMDNKENLLDELDNFIAELSKYRDAIESEDELALTKLLLEGKKRKEKISGGKNLKRDGEECISCKLEQ